MKKNKKILPDREKVKLFEEKIGTFGKRLRKLRKEQGLSQLKLAEKIGLKTSVSICKMELDKTTPDIKTLAKLEKILKADLHWLITGKPSPGTINLTNALKPIIEEYVSATLKEVNELNQRLDGLDLARIFRGEVADAEVREIKEKIKTAQAEYDFIAQVFTDPMRLELGENKKPKKTQKTRKI